MDKKKISKVLVLGDSFTELPLDRSRELHWLSYLQYHFGWKIINLSKSGSGISRVVHELLNFNDDFDLCIIAHSNASRLFHPDVWDINHGTAIANTSLRKSGLNNSDLWNAATQYYTNFQNIIIDNVKGLGLRLWIDEFIQKKYHDKLFIHFECFPLINSEEKIGSKKNQRLYHIFKHGVTMYPPLMYSSINCPSRPDDMSKDNRLCHLGPNMHLQIFEKVKKIIEEMQENSITNFNNKVYIHNNDFTYNEIKVGIDYYA